MSLKIWYQAARPRSLTATYVPIALGGVLAWRDDAFNLFYLFLALLGTLSLQIAANLFNEYFDYVKGVESGKSHGLGLILKNEYLTPRQVLIGALASLGLGILIGLFFVWQTGLTVLWIGMAAVAVVILYTAGPVALAYIGLGEVAVFIFMGPLIVYGTYYVMSENYHADVISAALPVGFLVSAIMHANNQRDLEADRVGGKQTLSVRFGRRFAQAFYVFLVGGAYVTTLLLILFGAGSIALVLAFITLPEAIRLMRVVLTSEETPDLHGVLVHTARLHAWFGSSYVLAWLIASI